MMTMLTVNIIVTIVLVSILVTTEGVLLYAIGENGVEEPSEFAEEMSQP
jgi:hypothetical protein